MSEFLWHSIRCHIGIKDSLPKKANLYEYTWKFIACMLITGEGRSGLDIWPETSNQDTGTEDMIFTTWYKKVMK